MRVGLEVRTLVGAEVRGLTRYTTNLMRGLSECPGIELTLFSREAPHPSHLEGANAAVVCSDAGREWAWYDRWLAAEIRNRKIDVFHAPADRGLPIRRSCPTVVTVHGSYERAHWKELFPGLKQKLWYWRHEFANGRADAVITVSQTTRNELIELGYRAERVHAIYPAAAPEFKSLPDPRDEDVLEKHGVKQPYFLCVSGYNAHKNLDTLVKAFALADVPRHQLVIVAGQRWGYEECRKRWASLPVFERLRLLEVPESELPALYRRAAAYINPSRWESFGFQLVEAMASGAPLLCSNAHALPEVAGEAAEYFNPNSAEELSGLMNAVSREPARLDALKAAGARRNRLFSWTQAARQTMEIYRQVAGL